MIRTLTAFGTALALVGSAHAQSSQIVVKLDGKSPRAARSELYRAAEEVCANGSALDTVDAACVEATYSEALHQLRTKPRVEQTAYVQPSPRGLR